MIKFVLISIAIILVILGIYSNKTTEKSSPTSPVFTKKKKVIKTEEVRVETHLPKSENKKQISKNKKVIIPLNNGSSRNTKEEDLALMGLLKVEDTDQDTVLAPTVKERRELEKKLYAFGKDQKHTESHKIAEKESVELLKMNLKIHLPK